MGADVAGRSMEHEYHLAELRVRLMAVKDRLSRERVSIFAQFPPTQPRFDKAGREAYGFAYIRAERLGVRAIRHRMEELTWLPAQIDTSTEITADIRDKLAHWIKTGDMVAPDMKVFGNDFIHALARCLLTADADSPGFRQLTDRIALLFRDLAYLVSSIHCCNIFKELEIDSVHLSAPHDLGKIALDLTATLEALALMQSEEEDDGDTFFTKPANQPGGVPYLRLVPNPNEGAEAPAR
jgi:hypothetical protein